MSDINLLENQLTTDNSYKQKTILHTVQSVLVWLLVVVLLAGGVFLGWGKWQQKSLAAASAEIQQGRGKLEASIMEKRDRVVGFQSQLENLNQILPGHTYWSEVLSLIASTAITGIEFRQLAGSTQGTISIEGFAPDVTIIAAFTKKLGETKGVRQVVLNSSSLSNLEAGGGRYSFNVSLTVDPSLFLNQNNNK